MRCQACWGSMAWRAQAPWYSTWQLAQVQGPWICWVLLKVQPLSSGTTSLLSAALQLRG